MISTFVPFAMLAEVEDVLAFLYTFVAAFTTARAIACGSSEGLAVGVGVAALGSDRYFL